MPFCPRCGKEVEPNAAFCSNCGAALTQQQVFQPVQQPTYPSAGMTVTTRPTGVTIMAVLEILSGIISFGIAMFVMSASAYLLRGMFGMFEAFVGLLGGILLILGLIPFVLAYGLLTGKGWAWTITFALHILGVLVNLAILPMSFFSLVINIVMIYYLTRPHVKTFFRK